MRFLLASDPLLPSEAREAVASGRHDAREHLVRLGLDDCEAAELLDRPCDDASALLDAPCGC